jgi:hypothetical protein
MGINMFNSFHVIRIFAVRVTLIFANKKHALTGFKLMAHI